MGKVEGLAIAAGPRAIHDETVADVESVRTESQRSPRLGVTGVPVVIAVVHGCHLEVCFGQVGIQGDRPRRGLPRRLDTG